MGKQEDATDVVSSKNFQTLLKVAKNLVECRCFVEEDIYDFVIAQIDDLDGSGRLPYQYIGKFAHDQAITNYRSFYLLEKTGKLSKEEILFQLSPEVRVREYLESDLSYLGGEVRRRRSGDIKKIASAMILDQISVVEIPKISPLYVASCPTLLKVPMINVNIDKPKISEFISFIKKSPSPEDPSHRVLNSEEFNLVEKGFMFLSWEKYLINQNLIHKMRNGLQVMGLSKITINDRDYDLFV